MLLDNLPHRCTIRRRVRSKTTLGGSKPSFTTEQTGVECWEQRAGDNESKDYEKQGMMVTTKVYFVEDPGVTARHQILITSRNGVTVTTPLVLEVMSKAVPDASAGKQILWRVMCGINTGEGD